MVPQIFFWVGVIVLSYTGLYSWFGGSDVKRGAIAFPFMLLLAAAVAKYVGY